MARLHADEDFPFGAVVALRALGHDVTAVTESQRRRIPDAEVLADATAENRAVLTHNHRHFRRLHITCHPHGGIISCTRDDNDPPALANRVHQAISVVGDLTNQFLRVIRPNP